MRGVGSAFFDRSKFSVLFRKRDGASFSRGEINFSNEIFANRHRADEGLTLGTSAFKLFTVTSLRQQNTVDNTKLLYPVTTLPEPRQGEIWTFYRSCHIVENK